jgi:hypothetical protein
MSDLLTSALRDSDPRDISRHRVFKAGKIAFNRAGVIDCIIRNWSETGACLSVASPLGIPEHFRLLRDGHDPQMCRVVWRKDKQIGIAFE